MKKIDQQQPTGKVKGSGISVLRLFTFNMVIWVEGPPFVDSYGIYFGVNCVILS